MPEDATIRPFTVGFPETELTDLCSRVNATRWPEVETVADDSQGAPPATGAPSSAGQAARSSTDSLTEDW